MSTGKKTGKKIKSLIWFDKMELNGFYKSPASMEPMLPKEDGVLQELSLELFKASAWLAGKLHPVTRKAVAGLLKSINCYYSNLIEGHQTHLHDIERALNEDYQEDPEKKALQLESKAHIETQNIVEAKLAGTPDIDICEMKFLCWIHKEFYQRMPEEFSAIKGIDGKTFESVVPGKFRTRQVKVGNHIPPHYKRLPAFLKRFKEAYKFQNLQGASKIIAAAASHHRLMWIHPFLDGNGRVTRLFTDAFMSKNGLEGHGLWTVNRGFARNCEAYMKALTLGDSMRQGDYDGRGNLSEQGLSAFCRYFIETSIDQALFMEKLLDLDGLLDRIRGYAAMRHHGKIPEKMPLRDEAGYLLSEVFLHGHVRRGEAARITGLGVRNARSLVSKLLSERLLISDSHKAPLRLGLPAHVVDFYFPNL